MKPLEPRATYARFEVYEPGRRPVRVDLSDNTNQAAPSPGVRALLASVDPSIVARYPSVYGKALKRAIAGYLGVGERSIVTGCGSDDVLDAAVRAFTVPGDRLAYPWPTFSMLPHLALANGLEPVAVPLGDLGALSAVNARVTYLCSPNNPTGDAWSKNDIREVVRATKGLVVVDEAYVEYGGESLAAEASALGRVLVTRTLSKAFGLAGLRVGYGIGASELVVAVEKARGPYKVGGLAEAAAVVALEDDLPWVRARAREVVEERERFAGMVRALGLAPRPSQANFVLLPHRAPKELAEALFERGIGVRAFDDGVRITIGLRAQMDEVLAALREVAR